VTDLLSPDEIAIRAQMAALLEASAPKPGNVGPAHDFRDAGYEHFLLSAAAIGPALRDVARAGVGPTILRAVRDTRRWVPANTNLGIVLLLAPLARAAAAGGTNLREALGRVLAGLSVADAEAAYEAIRLAQPGGLGEAPEQDVATSPTVSLRQAMQLAADRDAIAAEYVSDYAVTFGVGRPAFAGARAESASLREAALECFLAILAEVPDSLIARKCGRETALVVSREAASILDETRPGSPARAEALAAFDASLRSESNSLNPGTTADLTAASIFVHLLEQGPSGPE
jgi:triphosphoribosyl-dephospho-CoA synthase